MSQKTGIGGPGGLPWSPQGRGEGLRERGKLRVEKVGGEGKTTRRKSWFPLSLLFDYFAKSRVCLAFPKANTRSLHKTPAYNRKKPSFLQFWHTAFAQGRGGGGAKTLVGMTGFGPQSSVPQISEWLGTGKFHDFSRNWMNKSYF